MRRIFFSLAVCLFFGLPAIAQNTLVATTTTMSFSPNPVVYPGSTSVTVKVTPATGTVAPSGSVQLKVGTTVLATFPMSNGMFTTSLPTSGYPAGVYGLKAFYEGNTLFAASTSPNVNLTLKSPVTVTETASPNPLAVGQTVTLKATVAATDGGGTPTGTVSYKVGTDVVATVPLSKGVATLTAPTTGYAAGTYPIVAAYNGDSLHAVKSSSAVNLTLVSDPSITTTNTPTATDGSPYTETFTAKGGTGNYSWSITSGLSALQGIGMSFSSGGVLSGMPTATGSYQYTVQVQDTTTGETASAPYTLVVSALPNGCINGTGYTVSGTVSYSGAKTGRIYIGVGGSCGGGTTGTSISATGAFTIHGVPAGSFILNAFMDTLGHGVLNAQDPTGTSATVTVTDANVSGVSITLTDPSTVILSSGPQLQGVTGFNTGAIAFFNDLSNNDGVETATSYTMQWSTSSSFTTVAGSKTFAAEGNHSNVWLVNGLTNGTPYYFRAYGTSGGTAMSSFSSVVGPVTIGASTTGDAVSGTVTFSGTATGPLYVVLINQTSQTPSVYIDYIANPVSPQSFSIQAPAGSYQIGGIVDQNNNGAFDAGDFQDIAGNQNPPSITVNGPLPNQDLMLPSGNGFALVNTQNVLSVGPGESIYNYGLSLQMYFMAKLPVAVTLQSSSNSDGANVVGPIDIASCNTTNSSCGQGFQIQYPLSVDSEVGDTYTFSVTYSDGTTGMLTYSLPAVLNAYATNLAPTTGNSTSTTPTFTWTDPANASNYTYQFSLSDAEDQLWQIPGHNASGNGFPSSITSITWGVDPTGGGSTPSVPSLSDSTNYEWQIDVIDGYGNQAFTQVGYQP